MMLQPRSYVTDVTEGCGESKGCYRNPPGCSEKTCDIVVTWNNSNDRSYQYKFEMVADTDGWVALGLSDDKFMACPHSYLSLLSTVCMCL